METHDAPSTDPRWHEIEQKVEELFTISDIAIHALYSRILDEIHRGEHDGLDKRTGT